MYCRNARILCVCVCVCTECPRSSWHRMSQVIMAPNVPGHHGTECPRSSWHRMSHVIMAPNVPVHHGTECPRSSWHRMSHVIMPLADILGLIPGSKPYATPRLRSCQHGVRIDITQHAQRDFQQIFLERLESMQIVGFLVTGGLRVWFS